MLLDLVKGGLRKADNLGTELAGGGLNGLTGVVLFFTTALVDGTGSSGSCLMPSEELKVTIGFFTSQSIRVSFKSAAIGGKKK